MSDLSYVRTRPGSFVSEFCSGETDSLATYSDWESYIRKDAKIPRSCFLETSFTEAETSLDRSLCSYGARLLHAEMLSFFRRFKFNKIGMNAVGSSFKKTNLK